MSDFLAQMARTSAERARRISVAEVRARLLDQPPPIALDTARFGLIAEVKLQAPSAGVLASPPDPVRAVVQRARQYVAAGAAAVSVLTEPDLFGGTLAHLAAASAAVDRPVMRKDFLVDPLQILEARAAGASGVLLIVRLLDDARLAEMLSLSSELGLFALVEAFDESDLDRAGACSASLVGVNCRDLRTLSIRPERFASLASSISSDAVGVAESGLFTEDDAHAVASLGYRMALVGTALMQEVDPTHRLVAMIEAGRRASEEAACASA